MKEALTDRVNDTDIAAPAERFCIGTIVAIESDGRVAVDFPGNSEGPVQAYYTNAFKNQLESSADLDQQKVLLVFQEDELEFPIIVDTLHSKLAVDPEPLVVDAKSLDEVVVDGKRVTLEAQEEITLRCGKSSIQLTRAGKIIIRGAYLLNRSSGVNRIKGGSVQIN